MIKLSAGLGPWKVRIQRWSQREKISWSSIAMRIGVRNKLMGFPHEMRCRDRGNQCLCFFVALRAPSQLLLRFFSAQTEPIERDRIREHLSLWLCRNGQGCLERVFFSKLKWTTKFCRKMSCLFHQEKRMCLFLSQRGSKDTVAFFHVASFSSPHKRK